MATINVSLPADGETADSADYNLPITTIVDEFNGNIDNANIKSGAAIDGAKLADASVTSAKLALVNYQTDTNGTIANVSNGNIKIQAGWGQKLGDNVSTVMQDSITFPTAFATVLGVMAVPLGVNASGQQDLTNFTASWGAAGTQPTYTTEDITTTGFVVNMSRSSGSFGNTTAYGFSWIAWGII